MAYLRFNSEHPFILETDASAKGLGAVLTQQQEDDKVHPIAFASRSLNVQERNYGIIKMESLAVVWADKLFQAYLLGHHCEVITDHAACTSLLSHRNLSSKLTRLAMCIQELDLKIHHRPGKNNLVADALSQHPLPVADVLQVTADARVEDAPENDIAKLRDKTMNLQPSSSGLREEACQQTLIKLST